MCRPVAKPLLILTLMGALLASPGLHARVARRSPAAALDVQPIGARPSRVTAAMQARVRELVARHLRVLTETHLLTSPRGYFVDGSIDALDVVVKPELIEISCGVRLILSGRASGAILAMASGQATLKNPRRQVKPGVQPRLELEALDGAVRAATDELIAHFEGRRRT